MNAQQALARLIQREDLSHAEMLAVMGGIMRGEYSQIQTAGVLTALRMKGETVEEIAAAAQVMRQLAAKVEVADVPHLLDTCGTGGDSAHTFNVSTAAALVAAAAGARVAKHGNRSVSSSSGSADVLEAMGVNISALTPEHVARSIRTVGIGFMFAPAHHSAMKYAVPVRRELGVRTIFNILGPLTNPAGAPNQLMGVYARDLVSVQARVLQSLGSRHVMVVHGEDGLDEITLAGITHVAEVRDGKIDEFIIEPARFGIRQTALTAIKVGDVTASKAQILSVLDNAPGPARDIVQLNAGAAIYVAGLAISLEHGIARASAVIASGAARAKLAQLVSFTQQL